MPWLTPGKLGISVKQMCVLAGSLSAVAIPRYRWGSVSSTCVCVFLVCINAIEFHREEWWSVEAHVCVCLLVVCINAIAISN